jgi:hypothetical protein
VAIFFFCERLKGIRVHLSRLGGCLRVIMLPAMQLEVGDFALSGLGRGRIVLNRVFSYHNSGKKHADGCRVNES